MLNKILDRISSKNKLDENLRKKIKNYPKVRKRLVNMIIKNGAVGDSKMKIIKNFITFFGCGKVKTGPGTFASFASILVWFGCTMIFLQFHIPYIFEVIFWSVILLVIFAYSLVLIPIYSAGFEDTDHPSIVIDEVIGQILTLCLTYPFVREFYQDQSWFLTKIIMFSHMFLCFITFRMLDIAKPLIIGWADQNIKGSFGVIFDDILAGIFAAIINICFFLAYESSIMQLHHY